MIPHIPPELVDHREMLGLYVVPQRFAKRTIRGGVALGVIPTGVDRSEHGKNRLIRVKLIVLFQASGCGLALRRLRNRR
jgi:hypothetical protein